MSAAKVNIFDSTGLNVRAVTSSLEYHGEWMGDEYVSVSVKSPVPVDFAVGDKLTYRGRVYTLYTDANVVKKARSGTYGEGFTYDNVKLYSIGTRLTKYEFKDYVLNDNNLPYTSLDTFSFFAASVEDYADRLMANLVRVGETGWVILTPSKSRSVQRHDGRYTQLEIETLWAANYASRAEDPESPSGEQDVNVEISGEKCRDTLKIVYEQFGLGWRIDGEKIIIGGDPVRADYLFRYGKGNGLYEIERTTDDQQELVSRLFAYGSETNLPLNYYANMCKTGWCWNNNTNVNLDLTSEAGKEAYLARHSFTYYFEYRPSLVKALNIGIKTLGRVTSWYVKVAANGIEVTGQVYEVVENGQFVLGFRLQDTEATLHTPYDNDPEVLYAFNSEILDTAEIRKNSDNESVILFRQIKFDFIEGVDINLMPADRVDISSGYPAALSINKLMLPGFPLQSLKAWVCNKAGITAGSVTSSVGPNSEQEVPYLPDTDPDHEVKNAWRRLLRKYGFSTNALDPWVRSGNETVTGLHEGTVNYDGSNQKEIYPTIENTPAGVVVEGSSVTDNGYLPEDASDSDRRFTIKVAKTSSLDWHEAWDNALDTNAIRIEMRSGYCTGMAFKLVYRPSTSDDVDWWELTLERYQENERYYPYFEDALSKYCQVRGIEESGGSVTYGGDTFVVTGIQMPSGYIEAAAEKMLIACCGYLDKRDHVRYTYIPRIDELFIGREYDGKLVKAESLYMMLVAGIQIQFEDAADLGIERYGDASLFIDQLNIKEEGNGDLPTFDVVMREEKEKGTLDKLTEQISALVKDPPVQVVERPQRVLQYIEYDSWERGKYYYFETLNIDENRLETSRVWNYGVLWECRRTGTTEEPRWDCTEWVAISGNTNFTIEFASSNGYSFRRGHVNTTVTPHLFYGSTDITDEIIAEFWSWTRCEERNWNNGHPTYTDSDETWNAQHNMVKGVTLANADMPEAWSSSNKTIFTCSVTVNDGDDTITVENQIIS